MTDSYEKQTDNSNLSQCILNALLYALLLTTFSIRFEMKGSLEIG